MGTPMVRSIKDEVPDKANLHHLVLLTIQKYRAVVDIFSLAMENGNTGLAAVAAMELGHGAEVFGEMLARLDAETIYRIATQEELRQELYRQYRAEMDRRNQLWED